MSSRIDRLGDAPAVDAAGRMDAIYRYQRHFYDLTRKYYLLGRDRLIDRLAPPDGGSILEIGCGTGRNLILAARRYPDARFFGVDISAEMLATARDKVAAAGLSDRISFGLGDAADFDSVALFGEAAFDRLFFSYTLSMIPCWEQALAHAPSMLAPGGSIEIVDFGQQERLPRLFRSLLRAWLARFHVELREDLELVLEQLAAGADLDLSKDSLFRGYAWAASLNRR